MQENKTRDFNPLDILATAAALKCVDKRKTGETIGMTQHKDSLEEEQKSETSEDTDKRNRISSQNVARKLKLVTVCSDLEKMFDEHNYGNSRKSNKGSGSWSADITPSGKDRKVIVTVVDRSGDHRVVKTFNSIKVPTNAGKSAQANESDKNITPAAGETIKISCGEQSIDNSGDNCTSSQGNNSNKVNVNKGENLPDQVDLFTCSKQITSNTNDSLEGHSQNTVDSGLIHNTSACQSRIDSTAGNISSSELSICSEVDRQKIVYKEENVGQPEGKSDSEEQLVNHKLDINSDSDTSESTVKAEDHFHKNIENLSEKEISNSDSSESLNSQDTELQTELDPHNVNSVKTNTHTDSVILTGNGSQVRVISSQIEKVDDLTQPQKFIINISKNSVSSLPELNKPTDSDGERIDTVKEVIGEKCLNKTQDSRDSEKTSDVKLREKTTAHNYDRQVEKNDLVMSPLGIDSVPVGCSSCFRHFEDTSDSESWRNDGVPGRSDVRLSLDLDSPKSEGLENLSSVEEGSCNTLPKYDNGCDSCQKISDTTNNMVNETLSESDIVGQQTSETKNVPDTLPLSKDKQNCEINTYVDTGDHCYAGVSYASKQEKARPSFHHDESLSTDSLCDLSQDSGFGEVGHLPNFSETDGKRNEMSLVQKDNYEKSTPEVFVKSSDNSIPAILEVHNSNKLHDNRGIGSSKDTVITVLKSSENTYLQTALHSHMSPNTTVSSNKKETSPTFGKYCIGTFASVSNLAVGLESSNQTPQIIGVQKLNTPTKLAATSLLTNAVYKNQNLPLHMTPVKSGESLLTEKINGSLHTKQILDRMWKNHIEHDHDYCAQIDLESLGTAKQTKEAITKVKSRRNDSGEKKLRRSLVLTDTESLDFDSSNDALSLDESSEPASPSVPTISHSHGTRQKLKAEKIADYVKSGCSDSKLKITGSFQDDYIYFLNTKLRSRRRTTSQDFQPAIPPDKIFVPSPKPGDIVVPHLTDADLEAIRQGHPTAAKPTQRCPVSSSPSTNIPNLAISSSQNKNIPNPVSKLATSQVGQPPNGAGSFSDEESKIINTILSMENGESSSSQSSTETFTPDTSLFGSSGESLINLTPESISLTPEQMEILYSAMDEVQSLSPDVSKVDSKFSLDEQSKDSFSADSASPQEENKEIKDIDIAENAKDTTDSSLVISTTSTDVSSKSDTEALSTVPVDTEAKQIVPNNNDACPAVVTGSSLPDISFPSLDKSSLDIFGSDLKLFPEATVESTPPNTALVPHPSQSDNSAPWIVTVSMYWNDLPAIMIENLPYVRLVDIHKQILPAKDTGILKKRCQLLGIEVKNCTEMQRYFLVQYGKAFNSKSTLIVGKDCAKSLIGYYVNPSTNPHRLKEAKVVDRQMETYSDDMKATKSGNIVRSKQVPESSKKPENTELLQEMLKPVKDIAQHPSVTAAQLQYMSSPGTKAATGQQPSTRTRHKKINFLEMLKGDSNNNTEVSEEKEINIEKGHNSNVVDNTNSKLEKSKNKTVSPAVKDKVKSVQSSEESEKSEVNKHRTSTDESVQVELSTGESESENRGDGRFGIGSKKRARQIESHAKDKIHVTKKLKLDKKKAGPLKVKWTIFNKTNSQKSVGNKDKIEMKQEVLAIVHKDMTPRNGHRGRVQAGNIFVNLYEGTHSLCVKCCSCKKMLSVDNFLKHLHETGGSGKLTMVNQPQTLALRDNYPSEFQKKLWENFQKRKKMYSDSVRQQKLEERKISDKNTIKSSVRLDSVKAVPRDPNVRSSSRKRKPKQLHPIENYSFSKSAVQNCHSDDLVSDSHSAFMENNIESEEPSPCKLSKMLPNLSAGLETGLVQCEDLTSTSSLPSESVVTLTNGPEVISFTALENGFDV